MACIMSHLNIFNDEIFCEQSEIFPRPRHEKRFVSWESSIVKFEENVREETSSQTSVHQTSSNQLG